MLLYVLDLIGVGVFAITGALAAGRKRRSGGDYGCPFSRSNMAATIRPVDLR